jgi:site-specific recombinase XerD
MASLTTLPNSPFWLARMRVWVVAPEHPFGGFYRQTCRSTKLAKTSARRTAQRVADEMEQTARELRTATPDAAWFAARLESLMRSAGVSSARRKTTWTAAAAGWLAAKDVRPRSIERYESDIEHFRRFLGVRAGHDLQAVTPEDVSAFYHGLQADGLSANSARAVTKTVRSVLERAHVLRLIPSNPAKLLRMAAGPDSSRQPFTRKEVSALLAWLDKEKLPEWRTACLFGLYFGLRVQDAVSRSFEEIRDIDGLRVIAFVPMKKTRRGRTIMLPLVGELADLRGNGFITPKLAKRRHLASKDFSALLERSPIERDLARRGGRRMIAAKSFHSFRHTAASWMVDAGVDQRVRQMVCDHENAKVAAGYTHASVETMAEAIKKACRL